MTRSPVDFETVLADAQAYVEVQIQGLSEALPPPCREG